MQGNIKFTLRTALAIQAEQLDHYCTDKPYGEAVRAEILGKTNTEGLDLDEELPAHIINRHVPRGGAIEHAVYKAKEAKEKAARERRCFYVPGNRSIIDTIAAGTEQAYIGGETLEQIRQRYPGVEIWTLDDAVASIQKITYATMISLPTPITAEKYMEMLCCMPPLNWRNYGGGESFMLCEAETLDLHSIYCCIDGEYFQMVNSRFIKQGEIIALCRAAIDERNAIAQAEANANDDDEAENDDPLDDGDVAYDAMRDDELTD